MVLDLGFLRFDTGWVLLECIYITVLSQCQTIVWFGFYSTQLKTTLLTTLLWFYTLSPHQLTCFMVLMVDDFHNIHSYHTPARLVRTNVVHMASCIADVHPTVSAVTRPSSSLHRQVVINVNGQQKTCLGGIHVPSVLETLTNALRNMQNQFLDQLPQNMQNIDPGRLQAALRELRLV